MLIKYIQSLGIDPQSPDGKRLIEESILCLAGVNTAFDFQHNVKSIDLTRTGMSGKDLRLSLVEKSYFNLNVKFAALFLALSPTNADAYVKVQAYLSNEDIHAFREIFSRRKVKARVKQHCINHHLSLHDVSIKAMTIQVKLFDQYISKLNKHIKYKVYSKLSFVSRAENTPLADLHSEVMCKVLRAYHQLIPTKTSEAYILNYLRASSTKCVLNMIKAHTTGKRGRMVKGAADGFGGFDWDIVCESENQHRPQPANEGPEYSYESVTNTVSNEETRHVESAIMYDRLLSRYIGRKRAALEIMAGKNDDGFTAYLRKKKSIKDVDDHSDYQRRVSHVTFLNSIADYLGVIREAFMRFISSIGSVLTSHREYA